MRSVLLLLMPTLLGASDPGTALEFRTSLGTDPAESIQFVPPGSWDGLILGAATRRPLPQRQGAAGRTVEVWDRVPQGTARQEGFALYLEGLRERLAQALTLPPPSHGSLELAELMLSDPANPQKLDLTRVKSLQERFNRLPPNGSPVRP